MNDDCTQCREWEICPFHSKDSPKPILRIDFTPEEGLEVDDETPTVRSLDIPTSIVRVSSFDGETVQTYDNGRLIDKESAEVYTDWGLAVLAEVTHAWPGPQSKARTAGLEIDYSGCMAIGVGGYHSEHYGDSDECCQWCGAKQR